MIREITVILSIISEKERTKERRQMKSKKIFACMAMGLVGFVFSAYAQTHVEGEEYYKAGKYEDAKDLLVRSLKNPQTDKAVSDYYLGMIALGEKNATEAARCFDAGIAANAEYPYNYVGKGLLKLTAGDAKGAEVLFKEADKFSKKDASLQIAIARAYYAAGPEKYQKQIDKYVEKARKFDMKNPDIYVFEGDVLSDSKDYGRAGGMYEMAKDYNKNATYAYVKYADLYQMVNPDYGVKMLKELLTVNPNSALGQRQLADTYYDQKNFLKAAEEYGKYVQNPSHFKRDEARYIYLLYYAGENQKGYDYATKLLSGDPSNFTARQYQFWHAQKLPAMKGELVGMADALVAEAAKNPKENKITDYSYSLLADAYVEAKELDKAENLIRAALAANPQSADLTKELGSVLIEKSDYTGAADAYGKYASLKEPSFSDYKQLGTIQYYAAATNTADKSVMDKYLGLAGATAKKVQGEYPDHYWGYKLEADVLMLGGKSPEAVAVYEKALPMLEQSENKSYYTGDAKDILVALGKYYVEKKDNANAKTYFSKYLEYDPSNTEMAKYVESL